MDPQTSAHLVRLLRGISIELRIANDIAQNDSYGHYAAYTENDLDLRRDRYREEMT